MKEERNKNSSLDESDKSIIYKSNLTYCWEGVPARGVYLPRGCTCPGQGVPVQGVTAQRGGYLPRGCTCRECTCQGLPAWEGVSVKRMTDRCKNISLPQTSFAGGKNNSTLDSKINDGSMISQWETPTPRFGEKSGKVLLKTA